MKARKWNGSKWIRKERRLAIYLRDGMACVYCGATVEDGITLSLDHIRPHSKDGGNESSNLVTCCRKCNSSRGNRGLREFCKVVAGYINHGAVWQDLENFIWKTSRRKPDIATATKLLNRRNATIQTILQEQKGN